MSCLMLRNLNPPFCRYILCHLSYHQQFVWYPGYHGYQFYTTLLYSNNQCEQYMCSHSPGHNLVIEQSKSICMSVKGAWFPWPYLGRYFLCLNCLLQIGFKLLVANHVLQIVFLCISSVKDLCHWPTHPQNCPDSPDSHIIPKK